MFNIKLKRKSYRQLKGWSLCRIKVSAFCAILLIPITLPFLILIDLLRHLYSNFYYYYHDILSYIKYSVIKPIKNVFFVLFAEWED